MKLRKHEYPGRHRLLLALISLACVYPRRGHGGGMIRPLLAVDAASAAPPPEAASSPALPMPSTPDAIPTGTILDKTSNFFSKFESHGPTLTLTLRDPSRMTLASGSGSSGGERRSKLWASSSSRGNTGTTSKAQIMSDDRGFGILPKVAALFHISPSASTTNGHVVSTPTKSQFADGYMLDDGEIFLEPPSASSVEGSSPARGLFSIREMGTGILGGGWGSKTLSECAQNIHPELKHEIQSKTPPFPESAPWISGLSCGMIWSPFPVYKAGYPDGYGHKMLSVPHFIRCGVRLSLPRISTTIRSWTSTSRGITSTFTVENNDGPTVKDLDLGVTYREKTYGPGGTLELLLGRSRGYLPAPNVKLGDEMATVLQQTTDEYHRKNNHILVRLATGGQEKRKTLLSSISNNSLLSSIEYAKASFRLPTPWFLRTSYNDRLSVSPSFDLLEEKFHCVVSGDVGSSGRTRAVLRLDSTEDSTLTVVRALDESKIIAPTISLNSGKIVYDYYLNLDSKSGQQNESNRKVNSSIRAHVDPTKGILLKWTDGIRGGRSGGSCWVTECRVPLGTTAVGPLAADIRVGRRWAI